MSEYFITDVTSLNTADIKWTITSSNVNTGKGNSGTTFKIYRASPSVTNSQGREWRWIRLLDSFEYVRFKWS